VRRQLAIRIETQRLAEPMRRRLAERAHARQAVATIVDAPAERLPFADESFDTLVATLTLCTVADLPRALAEARRVLVPGGRLLFCEHVRSDDPRVARWQDRLAFPWRLAGRGCRPNRDTVAAIAQAGLTLDGVEHTPFPAGPWIVQPLATGAAVKPS